MIVLYIISAFVLLILLGSILDKLGEIKANSDAIVEQLENQESTQKAIGNILLGKGENE